MKRIKRPLVVAGVTLAVLLTGAGVASACPGDEHATTGQTQMKTDDDSQEKLQPPEQEVQQEEKTGPLSAQCTTALAGLSRDTAVNAALAAASSACGSDTASVGEALDAYAANL